MKTRRRCGIPVRCKRRKSRLCCRDCANREGCENVCLNDPSRCGQVEREEESFAVWQQREMARARGDSTEEEWLDDEYNRG